MGRRRSFATAYRSAGIRFCNSSRITYPFSSFSRRRRTFFQWLHSQSQSGILFCPDPTTTKTFGDTVKNTHRDWIWARGYIIIISSSLFKKSHYTVDSLGPIKKQGISASEQCDNAWFWISDHHHNSDLIPVGLTTFHWFVLLFCFNCHYNIQHLDIYDKLFFAEITNTQREDSDFSEPSRYQRLRR